MSEKAAYETFGTRPAGSSFTVEILGYQTLAEAASLARRFAGHRQSTVHLYRVPFLNTGSAAWASGEIEFVKSSLVNRTCRAGKSQRAGKAGSQPAPALVTLDGHRLSSLYRGPILRPNHLGLNTPESARGSASRMARSGSGSAIRGSIGWLNL